VETEAQLTYLQQHQCDQIQGYYFSRPITAEAFTQMRRDGKCLQVESMGTLI
jgi:EAL domain-containing protein (putative c-di-GMP-specific phosphodiesterase class I)